jgi:hypothetical protein
MFLRNRMLIVTLQGIRNARTRNIMSKACEFYLDLLMDKRLSRNISLHIHVKKKLDGDADGFCSVEDTNAAGRPREFLIELNKHRTTKAMLMTLAHELVHVKQFAKGELNESINAWSGKRISDKVDYWDQPWEIEAHGREKGLYVRFVEKYQLLDIDAQPMELGGNT